MAKFYSYFNMIIKIETTLQKDIKNYTNLKVLKREYVN